MAESKTKLEQHLDGARKTLKTSRKQLREDRPIAALSSVIMTIHYLVWAETVFRRARNGESGHDLDFAESTRVLQGMQSEMGV